jgi:hypothetical protein
MVSPRSHSLPTFSFSEVHKVSGILDDMSIHFLCSRRARVKLL